VIQGLKSLNQDLKKFHSANVINEGDILDAYMTSIETNESSIYENDLITKLIESVLNRIKQGNRENILIIDDLDRIDPEHIFRILNVFASHIDIANQTKDNKFGFDKILLSCDIKNIRNIFRAKFGMSADFNGYIDKFFTTDIYYFDNKQNLKDILFSIFRTIRMRKTMEEEFNPTWAKIFDYDEFLIDFISILIDKNLVNLRSIMKFRDREIDINIDKVRFSKQLEFSSNQFQIILQTKFLRALLGDFQHLIDAVRSLQSETLNIRNSDTYTHRALLILTYEIHELRRSEFDYDLKKIGNLQIKIENKFRDIPEIQVRHNTSSGPENKIFTTSEFLSVYEELCLLLYNINYLK
jgi:hypothetical protein